MSKMKNHNGEDQPVLIKSYAHLFVCLYLCCSDRVLACVSLPELVSRCCDLPVAEHSCSLRPCTRLLLPNTCIDLL